MKDCRNTVTRIKRKGILTFSNKNVHFTCSGKMFVNGDENLPFRLVLDDIFMTELKKHNTT